MVFLVINPRRPLFIAVSVFALALSANRANAQPRADKHQKIDQALLQAMREGGVTQRVIITLKPGYRSEMRKRLQNHGDVIQSEHASIEALVADIHSADVNELAARDEVA